MLLRRNIITRGRDATGGRVARASRVNLAAAAVARMRRRVAVEPIRIAASQLSLHDGSVKAVEIV